MKRNLTCGGFLTRTRGAEVLNLLSILEVAENWLSAFAFHKKEAYKEIKAQAKKCTSY